MHWFATIGRRLRALLRRDVVESEMSEELRLHFDMAVADGIRRGSRPAEARARARRLFGGMERVKEEYRDARGVRPLEELVQDARFALRTLRRAPLFASVVVLTLTLGIGANTAIFSVVRAVLLRALPYEDVGSVAMVWETDRDSGTDSENASVPDYFDFVQRARAFRSLAAFAPWPRNYTTGDGSTERVETAIVTRNFLATLGTAPMLGRDFTPAEDERGGPRVAIVSERFWRTRLGGEPEALGRTLRIDDSSFVVVGVMPGAVQFPSTETDVWLPAQLTPFWRPRSNHVIGVIGRLRSGVTLASAQAEMTGLAADIERQHPESNRARGVRLEALEDALLGPVRPALVVLMAAVGLVLLIACVNVANLLLARLASRQREVAVRAALGATGGRLTQQFIVESLLLTLAAAVAALLVAPLALRALVAIAPATLPRLDQIRLDWVVLASTLAVAVAVALAFGILPALARRRLALGEALRSGGTRGGGSGVVHHRLRGALVTAEVALAIVLVIGAGLLIQSFWRLRHVDPGWRSDNLLRVSFQLPTTRYPQDYSVFPTGWTRIIDFERELTTRAMAIPGVRGAAIAANDPLAAGFTNSFIIEGRESEAARGQAELATRPVSASYFRTVGVPLLAGRGFDASDHAAAPPVLIINDAAAKKYFPEGSALGHRLRFWGTWRTIIGVVGNERFAGLAKEPPPAMYPPITQAPMATASLLVRTAGDPSSAVAEVKKVFASLDRGVAPYGITTMADALDASVAQQRFLMLLLVTFAAVALMLALIGIYGVVSFGVTQRRHEIGVRLALGATGGDVVRYVLRDGARLAVIGSIIGAVGALAGTRLLASQLYDVRPADPLTFAAAVLVIVAAALIGSWIPARRASRVAPVTALRD